MYIYFFKNCNAVTRVLAVHDQEGGPCRPGMAACSRDVRPRYAWYESTADQETSEQGKTALGADFYSLAII